MDAYIVVGANYGDEGKGLITDYLASNKDCAVIRNNGGAQAGHTVQLNDERGGHRHVFKHLGAGTLRNRPTILTNKFIVNPLLFAPEFMKVQLMMQRTPVVHCNNTCAVTTPVDMIINQVLENIRGDERHGSCGIGIYETINRSVRGPRISIGMRSARVKEKVDEIFGDWFTRRLKEIGAPDYTSSEYNVDLLKDVFIDAFEDMRNKISLYDGDLPEDVRVEGGLVYENAQGLALDMLNKEDHPHLTPSQTGTYPALVNAFKSHTVLDNVYVIYVTRTYMTRHGAGPLPGERIGFTSDQDQTNTPHHFQGTLRYAPLDYEGMSKRINHDIENVKRYLEQFPSRRLSGGVHHGLAVTCLDQTEDAVDPDYVSDKLGLPLWLTSRGPTSDDVEAHSGFE